MTKYSKNKSRGRETQSVSSTRQGIHVSGANDAKDKIIARRRDMLPAEQMYGAEQKTTHLANDGAQLTFGGDCQELTTPEVT